MGELTTKLIGYEDISKEGRIVTGTEEVSLECNQYLAHRSLTEVLELWTGRLSSDWCTTNALRRHTPWLVHI